MFSAGGCGAGSGHGSVCSTPPPGPGAASSRLHPDEPAHPRRDGPSLPTGRGPGGAGPGAEPLGNPGDRGPVSRGVGGLCPWSSVHERFWSMLPQRGLWRPGGRRPFRQPGTMRPALSLALRRPRRPGLRPLPERSLVHPAYAPARPGRRVFRQN